MEQSKIVIPEDTPFEVALTELEQLLSEMESGKKPLEELIGCFERGTALSNFCRNKLAKLEKRIEILTTDDGESGQWSDFADSVTSNNAPRR